MRDNENNLKSLTLQLEMNEKLISQLQSEIGFFRQEYAKVAETLNKFLLPPPKRGIWDRLRRKSK